MRRPRRSPPLALVATLALSPAACSSQPPQTPASPTPFFTTGRAGPPLPTGGATGSTAVSGPTGSFPTSSPASGDGGITRGEVTLRMTGDVRVTATLRELVSTVYTPPPGGIALVWTAGGTDPSTLGIGGSSFVGTQATGTALQLTLTVATGSGFETFVSFEGECDVTIAEASARRVDGSFRCASLMSSSGVVVDVAATFSASG
ncbi:MAG TPA: hypothetical protein VEC09_00780 [Actinomycetota bacterium]|nr:hypothetical protein [Actinomycetota bacterium]